VKSAHVPPDLSNRVLKPLQDALKRVDHLQGVADIMQEQAEAQALEEDAYTIINDFIEQQQAQHKPKPQEDYPTPKGDEIPDHDKRKVAEKPLSPPAKKMVTVDTSSIARKINGAGIIETDADIDNYINALKQELTTLINANNKIRIR
jgi:hypothetical protein